MGNHLSVFFWNCIMELETRRLLLRPLREEDAPAMALALNNLNVSKNLARVKFPYGLEDAQAFIALQRGFDPRSVVSAIAFRCAPDELVGVISYERVSDGQFEFGYWLRECCWHMGLMSEAAKAVIAHAFTQEGIETLHSAYHLDNPNSGRILRKLGFEETHQEMSFCLAQNTKVPSMSLRLNRSHCFGLRGMKAFDKEKGRAA
jgi:RimJ/RimL family protein N-acetyltransferase